MRRPYRKLNLDERRILATMLQAKATKTKIAETLGRDQSTIHREIKRNWWHDDEVPQADGYWHVTAQTLADQRHLKRRKLECHEDLRKEVIAKLKDGWSPEQIAGRLKIEARSPYRLCHETIYQYVYSESGQSQELGRYLPATLALAISALLGGTVIVESIFGWPGLGRLILEAIAQRDFPVIQAYLVFMGLIFFVTSLIADLAVILSDPQLRRRYSDE